MLRPKSPSLLAPEIPGLSGGIVRDIHQTSSDELTVETYAPESGAALWLFSANRDYPRIVRTFSRARSPARPPVFCQWLRTRLIGGIVGRPLLFKERVMAVPATKAGETLWLVLEQNGPDSNLLLLDGAKRLLIALHRPSQPGRRLTPGDPYRPPQRLKSLPQDAPEQTAVPHNLAAARDLDQIWRRMEQQAHLQRKRGELLRRVRSRLKRLARRLAKQRVDLANTRDAGRHKHWGDLLKINRHRLGANQRSLRVIDEFDPQRPEVEIPLDPQATPSANMERHFHRYRKLLLAAPHVERRLSQTRAELKMWRATEAAIRALASPDDLHRLEDGWSKEQRAELRPPTAGGLRGTAQLSVMTRLSSDGYLIFAGRNKTENDRVTFRIANGRDWWFHAQGIPGAHVIVRNPRGGNLPQSTVAEAAWLAAYYSQRREEGGLEIDYTQRKYVRKVKGGEPGQVTYSQNRTIRVDLAGAAQRILHAEVDESD